MEPRILPVFLILLVILPMTGTSQQFIRGQVIDNDNEAPLSKASIQVSGDKGFGVSDDSGHFTIQLNQPAATDTLVVSYVGYSKYFLPLSNTASQTDLIIRMKKEVSLLKEVTVYSQFWLKEYSPEELKEDYVKFSMIMEKAHTGLFDYISEKEWSALKDSSLLLCRYPMTHSEFYQLIALHVGKVRNKHTRHGVTDWWYRNKQNIFPFNIRYFSDKMYVTESLVNDLSFPKGTEILTVNDWTPQQMKSRILPFIPGDGYNLTSRMADLNDYFPWYFTLFVEEAKTYTIELKTLEGKDTIINTPGLRDSFAHLSFQQLQRWKKPALELRIDAALNTAYFRIEDSRVFKDSLHTYFERLRDQDIQYLIMDLRGGGGIREEEHVAELYSYLVDKPFRVYERIEVKSNDYNLFDQDFTFRPYASSRKQIKEQFFDKLVDSGKGYYLWEEESYMGLIKPARIHFPAVVYILTDGRNYSASTDFTSLASKLGNVFIIGEETGGEYRSYVSGAMFGLVLPNSKIGVKIPTWKSVLAIEENPSQRGRGVIPDFQVDQTFDDFVNDRDVVKEFAYELVRNKKQE